MERKELAIPDHPTAMIHADRGDSLADWIVAYGEAEVAGSPKATIDAKRRDLQLFLDYFARSIRSDHIDDWTKSVTKGFVSWLESEGNHGRPYAATTVNRILATIRHCSKWVQRRRGFVAGDPFDGISDLMTDEPPPLGLSPLQEKRLYAAADKLLALQTRSNQQPLKKRAILLLLLRTALRVSATPL